MCFFEKNMQMEEGNIQISSSYNPIGACEAHEARGFE